MAIRSTLSTIARFMARRLWGDDSSRKAVFEKIFTRNAWGSSESASGRGSETEFTATLRGALPQLIRELGVKSLLDAPCGDFNWMKHVDLEGIRYLGVDIVPELIKRNRERHGRSGVNFAVADLVCESSPRVDLVICRHCLIHLPNAEVRAAISKFCDSRSTWLLTTHSPNIQSNSDIEAGSFRLINLARPPFNFPKPERLILDEPPAACGGAGYLGLWRLADLASAGY